MQPYVIGIDIGTGSTKAVAIDSSGKIISSSQFYYPSITGLARGYVEQDAGLIWEAFLNAIRKITNTLNAAPSGISLSSCMHSIMAVNKKQEQLTNLITWADTRSEKNADEIRKSSEAESLYRITGAPIHSMTPLCKIIWLRKNKPEVFVNAFKFISIKEYIWHRLFNEYQVDYSIACGTGLFNIETLEWNKSSLQLCCINSDQLSKLVSTKYVRHDLTIKVASLLNVNAGTPICIGASDGCLANAGSFAVDCGIAAVTIGTSAAVRIARPEPVFNFHAMTFNYLLDEKNFICGSPVNNGGNVVQWLFKSLLHNLNPSDNDYDDLFRKVELIPAGSESLLFLPYLHGERAPVWDEKTCGVYFGIKPYHNQEHFLRAALEGVCYSLNNILQIVEASTGAVMQLNVSGGFVNSIPWMKLLADVTGKNVCVIQVYDASAAGAAILGMIALEIIVDYGVVKPGSFNIIKPDENNHKIYEKFFDVYNKLYHRLKEPMHQLYNINS